jgi:tetratricopeptide (TPR) repeat protein
MNGRIGQPQHGVDIFGNRGGLGGPMVGVQCKGKDGEYGGAVTELELKAEVKKSDQFKPAIEEFILITTAPDDAKIQETARLFQQQILAEGRRLSIAVWGWGRIEEEISQYPEAIRAFHPDATPFSDEMQGDLRKILQILQQQQQEQQQITVYQQSQSQIVFSEQTQIADDTYEAMGALDKHLHDQIDTYRDYLRAGRPSTALELLEKLKAQVFNTASAKIKFRILGNIGSAYYQLGQQDRAADYFIEAYSFSPDEITAIANEIAGLLIKKRRGEARELAGVAFVTHPNNPDIALQYLQAMHPEQDIESLWPTLDESIRSNVNLIVMRIAALREKQDTRWRTILKDALTQSPEHPTLKILGAEAVLERVLETDSSMLGLQTADGPKQAELLDAATTLEKAWEESKAGERPPQTAIAHNGALLWRLLRENDRAKRMLDTGLAAGLNVDEAIRLRITLCKRPEETAEAVKLAERLSDSRHNRIFRADLLSDADPEKGRELLFDREEFEGRDAIGAAMVIVEGLTKQGKLNEALNEAERLKAALPDDPNVYLMAYRIKVAGADEGTNAELDAAISKLTAETNFPTRFLVAEALETADRHDDVVDVLAEHVSTAFDSMALRMLIAAAANGDRRSTLRSLLDGLTPDVATLPFYRSARLALAIKAGDMPAAEKEIRGYLEDRPRALDMQLQLMHCLFRQNKIEDLQGEAARPASEFDGSPLNFMQLAQFKEGFGDWREAYALAYSTLIKNPNDAAASMAYMPLFLHPGRSDTLDVSPSSVAENMAVQVADSNRVIHTYVIEPDSRLRPSADYIPPAHRISRELLGKSLNDRIQLPDGTDATIISIRPKEVYGLHELMENFQNRFPETSGFERVQVDVSSKAGLKPIAEKLQQRHDAIATVTSAYESGLIPLALAGQMLGIDAVEMMTGLSTHGHLIRVCQGPNWERNSAFAAIEKNQARGCILDYLTLHVARRLGVIDVVAKICGPIGVVDATSQRYQRKIFEMQQTIDEPDKSIFWKDGEVYRTETPIEVKREALDLLKSDAAWIDRNCKIIPAEGKRDLGGDIRELVQRFGSGFVDELQAAQGSGILFVSEDNALRLVGQSEFGVSVTWLQPILMKAKNGGLLPELDYTKAVVTMIDAKFHFITIDAEDIERTVAELRETALPKDFRILTSRLGGKAADLRSHVAVALKALILIWPSRTIPHVAKLAIVGELLTNLVKERPIPEIRQILGEFVRFGQGTLKDFDLSQYIIDWCRGHFIPILDRA